jgi:hypothetical protein
MKRQLTSQEKRTIRIAAICAGVYLALFYGSAGLDYLTERRVACDNLLQQARDLRDVIKPYEEKITTATNLMGHFHMDPAKLKRSSVVAEASAAIQQTAASGGVAVGPIRETPGRPSAKEAGSIQFEGTGQVAAVLELLHNLDRIGFPVIIDSVQINADPRMPNMVKVNMTIVVLDFDAWKPKEEAPHV